jgi:hypothetical protein
MNNNLAYDLTATGEKYYKQDTTKSQKVPAVVFTDCGSSAHGIYLASDSTLSKKLLDESQKAPTKRAYDFFEKADLGEGGYALAPASQAKQAIKDIIRRKFNR